ncbi:hypothetical protein [Pelosinus sp. UFO1]|uniref:hypothetical protein n=1 Tax=Pelosinus sp. UFO1 TaxID=484770 RepID=UPI001F24E52E|nr:hypothetical protein [Pelosinus sp. UFO1]
MGVRLRRHYKNYKRSIVQDEKNTETVMNGEGLAENMEKLENKQTENEAREPKKVKSKSFRPTKMINQIMNNPNFNLQLIVILLTLSSEGIQMDRRIEGMTSTIDKVRNITELVNNGMQSMKMVSEVPKSIRRILE